MTEPNRQQSHGTEKKGKMPPVGFHVSISGGLEKAVERAQRRGCSGFQIFCGNPRGWALRQRSSGETRAFSEALDAARISTVAIHACYLINPCTDTPRIRSLTVKRLSEELTAASQSGADYYVLHPGSQKGKSPLKGIELAARAIAEALRRARIKQDIPAILLENTAGNYGPGGTLAGLGGLRDAVEALDGSVQTGFALDTCHAHAAGYDLTDLHDIERLHSDIDAHLHFDSVKLIHANDSVHAPGSCRDRHEHIGEGTIGEAGFCNFFSIPGMSGLPVILETPWDGEEADRRNLKRLVRLHPGAASSPHDTPDLPD